MQVTLACVHNLIKQAYNILIENLMTNLHTHIACKIDNIMQYRTLNTVDQLPPPNSDSLVLILIQPCGCSNQDIIHLSRSSLET